MCLGLQHGQRHAFAYLNDDHSHSADLSLDLCAYAAHLWHGTDPISCRGFGLVFERMDIDHRMSYLASGRRIGGIFFFYRRRLRAFDVAGGKHVGEVAIGR